MKATITTGKNNNMRNLVVLIVLVSVLFVQCHRAAVNDPVAAPKAQVEAVRFSTDTLMEEISFQAQSLYLVKNVVQAPIDCYIHETHIAPGDRVNPGQIIYEIITKERKAAENLQDTVYKQLGKIPIKAAKQGIITSLRGQTGDFMTMGTEMCQISTVQSLVFSMQVPLEYSQLVKPGGHCDIVFADGTIISGTIKNELGNMSIMAQTRQYLVKPANHFFIPENLIATAKLVCRKSVSSQVLPLRCLLSDEMMQNFWVMKLYNDTTAVKIAVKPGMKNKDKVEILDPVFLPTDRILSDGNYGLADTALVHVQQR